MNKVLTIVVILIVLIGGYFLLTSNNKEMNLSFSESIKGEWQSVEDSQSFKIFKEDGIAEDIYGGEVLSVGTWSIKDSSLEVYDGTELLKFSILILDENELSLSFLPRGNTLNFKRLK